MPRLVSQRGGNPSAATKLARYGNPLNRVLAPVQRMSIVASWTTKNITWPRGESPSTALATWR